MSIKKLEIKEISRDFEIKWISKLMRKRLFLFSFVLLFQASILFIIVSLFWYCRIKSEFQGDLTAVNPSAQLVQIRITCADPRFLFPGKQVKLKKQLSESDHLTCRAVIEGMEDGENGSLICSLTIPDDPVLEKGRTLSNPFLQLDQGTAIILEARTERLLNVLLSGRKFKVSANNFI